MIYIGTLEVLNFRRDHNLVVAFFLVFFFFFYIWNNTNEDQKRVYTVKHDGTSDFEFLKLRVESIKRKKNEKKPKAKIYRLTYRVIN